jgi:hypothetical protein
MDLDNVIANIHTAILPIFSAKMGKPYLPSKITGWGWGAKDEVPGAESTYVNIWSMVDTEDIDPQERNVGELLHRIKFHVDRLDIVTAHPDSCRDNILKWLERWRILPYECYDLLIPTNGNPKEKMGYDLYVDDCAELFPKLNKDQIMIVYDQPWNRGLEYIEFNRVFRIESLATVPQILGWLEKK